MSFEFDRKKLCGLAKAALKGAYAPYSNFYVGAAIIAENEAGEKKTFTGCNIENSSFGATICAERTAAVKAVSEGYRKFLAIAVCSGKGKVEICGICRQFLSEFCTEDMPVITGEDENSIEERCFRDVFPSAFILEKQTR